MNQAFGSTTGSRSVHYIAQSFGRLKSPAIALGLSLLCVLAAGCGRSGSGPVAASAPSLSGSDAESGAYSAKVELGEKLGAVVTLFPDGHAYFSPDGYNLQGGGKTVPAAPASDLIQQIVPVDGGVESLTQSGMTYFSRDGLNLAGGGNTVATTNGGVTVSAIVAVGSGVDAVVGSGTTLIFSPDGLNLGGGGKSVSVLSGSKTISQVLSAGSGNQAVVLYSDGTVAYTDNTATGQAIAQLATGLNPSVAPVKKLLKVGRGMIAEVADGTDYLSADAQPVGPSAGSVVVPAWQALPEGNFGPRDSGKGAVFNGRLWLSGGFIGNTGVASCNYECSYFDLWASTDLSATDFGTAPVYQTSLLSSPRNSAGPLPTDFWDSYSPIVVFAGKLWAFGSSTWSSSDGSSWQSVKLADGTVAQAPDWEIATEDSRAFVVNSYVYYIQSSTGVVLRTTDPSTGVWENLGNIPGFTARCGAAVYVSRGTIFVEGGGSCDYLTLYHDVFSSTDGINWSHAKSESGWLPRLWPCVTADDSGTLWLVGGYAPVSYESSSGTVALGYAANFADVWYSKDGVSWAQFKADYGSGLSDDKIFEPRHAATCYAPTTAAGPTLVVLAGKGAPTADNYYAGPTQTVTTLALPAASELP